MRPLADVGVAGLDGQDEFVIVQVVVRVGRGVRVAPHLGLRQGGGVAAASLGLRLLLTVMSAVFLNKKYCHASGEIYRVFTLPLQWKEFDLWRGASEESSSMTSDLVMALELSTLSLLCLACPPPPPPPAL